MRKVLFGHEKKAEGFFHQFGTKTIEFDSGIAQFTVAIIEDNDGNIYACLPDEFKFNDNYFYDLKCPYCNGNITLDHENGYGHDAGFHFIQICDHCKKEIVYTPYETIDYVASKMEEFAGEKLIRQNFVPIE